MGMDRTIRFSTTETPTWDAVRAQLRRVGEDGTLRMIDGLPAFPDEAPDPAWRELRVGTAAGMVTLRRRADALNCVVWGNADSALMAAWHKVIWACAAAGPGTVETPSGPLPAADYAASVGLSPE